MKKYIIKRLIISVFILIFVAFIIYVLMRSLPTSYLEQVARQKSMQPGSKSYEEWMQQLSATYGMDKGIMDSARAMNLSNTSMILEILFPYAFAGVVGSLKVTFTTGIMLLTFAEMMGATSGMGYYIVNYNTYGNYTKVVAGIIVVGTVVTALNKCIDVLQKKLIVWEM